MTRSVSKVLSLFSTALLIVSGFIFSTEGFLTDTGAVEPGSRSDREIRFTNVSEEVGLSGHRGNFFSWGDYDNDRHQDLLVDGKSLFRNSGPPYYRFEDVTASAGLNRPVNSGVWGDYDNDGWLDIYCGGGRGSNDHPEYPDVLWHNEGDGSFREVTGSAAGTRVGGGDSRRSIRISKPVPFPTGRQMPRSRMRLSGPTVRPSRLFAAAMVRGSSWEARSRTRTPSWGRRPRCGASFTQSATRGSIQER